jgi:hypothetical protein
MHQVAYRDKDAPKDCPTSKNSFWMNARSKGEKDGTDLFEYFNPVLDELEADSRRIREMARPRI